MRKTDPKIVALPFREVHDNAPFMKGSECLTVFHKGSISLWDDFLCILSVIPLFSFSFRERSS